MQYNTLDGNVSNNYNDVINITDPTNVLYPKIYYYVANFSKI